MNFFAIFEFVLKSIFFILKITKQIMSKSAITKLANFDSTKLTFTELKAGGKGGKFGNAQYNGGMCLLQLPQVGCFGGEEYISDDGRKDYTMTLNITKEMQDESESVRNAVKGLENFEKALREHAKNNSLEFFGKKKKVTDDFIEASANKMLKPSKDRETGEEDGRYTAMKVKLGVSKKEEGKFNFGVFKEDKTKMEITPETVKDIKSRSKVKCTINPNIYVINGKLGVSWYLHQMQYWEPTNDGGIPPRDTFCLLSSDDEDEDNEADPNQLIDSDSD